MGELEEARNIAGEVHEPEEWMQAWDDVTGRWRLPELARKPRREEIQYFRKMKVYTKVEIVECRRVTGKGPIGVRWVDVNKECEIYPKYRSRLVAKETNTHSMPEMYAATPP